MTTFAYDIVSETRPVFGGPKSLAVRRYSHNKRTTSFSSYATLRENAYFLEAPSARSEFERLARTWQTDTVLQSNVTLKSLHPAYLKIIGMGKASVQYMLEDFQKGKIRHWFWALTAIVGEAGPSVSGIDGNVAAMAEAWVTWGKAKGYL